MIRDIVKDPILLSKKCKNFNLEEDNQQLLADLVETAMYHHEKGGCVGLACNQIGENKRLLVAWNGKAFFGLVNPVVTRKSKTTMMSTEDCLSIPGQRTVKRHTWIEVISIDPNTGKGMKNTFSGQTAIIVQHELDHLDGKLV